MVPNSHLPSQETGAYVNGSLREEPDAVKVARPVLKQRWGRRLPHRLYQHTSLLGDLPLATSPLFSEQAAMSQMSNVPSQPQSQTWSEPLRTRPAEMSPCPQCPMSGSSSSFVPAGGRCESSFASVRSSSESCPKRFCTNDVRCIKLDEGPCPRCPNRNNHSQIPILSGRQ
jgi:hypothetical protein